MSNCVAGGGRAISEWLLQELARREAPEGLDISVIANKVHSRAIDQSAFKQILMVDRSPVRSAAVRRSAHRFLRQNKVDLLFSLFGPSGLKHPYQIGGVANAFVTSNHRHLLRRIHGRYWLPHYFKYRLFRRSLKSSYKHIIFETDVERKNFLDLTGFDPLATDVIANGVAPQIKAASSFAFRELQQASDELRVLVVTSNYRHKNNDKLSDYISTIKDVWGGAVSMDVTLTASELLSAQGAEPDPNVRSLGRLSPVALAQAYIDADIVLMPSLLETYSAVYNEVRFFGKPLLCSDIPSAREICGEYAVFFNPHDLNELKSKMRHLLEHRLEISERTWEKRGETISPDHKFDLIFKLIRRHAKRTKVVA